MNVVVPPLCASLLNAFKCLSYINDYLQTLYNVIYVNKNINNSKVDNNNNGKSRINTSRTRQQKNRHSSTKNEYKMLNFR